MSQRQDILQRHAETIVQSIRSAFPDVPLPAGSRIGCGRWWRDEDGRLKYRYSGDGRQIEVFFRGVEWSDLTGNTPQETHDMRRRFFTTLPLAKRWTEVVGAPLLSWVAVTWSLNFMAPRARAYYLPAYMLTALPLLTTMPFETLPYVAGQADSVEFVGHILDALIPPLSVNVWESLTRLSPEVLDPHYVDFHELKREEEFLRFAGQFTIPQRGVIGRFVEFTFATYPFYVQPVDRGDVEERAALAACWIRPELV